MVEVLGQYQTNEQEVVYMIRNLQTIQQTNVLHALDIALWYAYKKLIILIFDNIYIFNIVSYLSSTYL